jgi:hypothetical protein
MRKIAWCRLLSNYDEEITMITHNKTGRGIAVLVAAANLGMCGIAGAQTTHHSFLHRHAGAVAGVAAYAAARHTGRSRLAHGRRRNFAQRHPMATGLAAAAVAHHYAKHH